MSEFSTLSYLSLDTVKILIPQLRFVCEHLSTLGLWWIGGSNQDLSLATFYYFDSVIVKLRSRSGEGQVNFGKVQVRLSLELNSKLKTET